MWIGPEGTANQGEVNNSIAYQGEGTAYQLQGEVNLTVNSFSDVVQQITRYQKEKQEQRAAL